MNASHASTAFLVIHGIGQQHPFETLDSFASALWNTLEEGRQTAVLKGKHRIASREQWIQHYVSLSAKQKDKADVYEYYWAHKAQRQVELKDIVEWLIQTSDGARKYYDENEEIAATYERTGVSAFHNNKFKKRWYLKHLGWLMRVLSIFPSIVSTWITARLGWLLMLLNPLFRWIEQTMIDFIGDVVIYTSTDIKSKFFLVRSEILNGAAEELKALLENPQYKQIVVAGHSLGSVIGFDTLNRINHAMNIGKINPRLAKKITGFVTFGSPLDKIAFFFRERTPDDQLLRRQILNHYHSFKAKPLEQLPEEKILSNPFKRMLEHVVWLNFWDPMDKVSGQLDFYKVDKNIQMNLGKNLATTHSAYWKEPEMYKVIVKQWL